MDEIEAIKASVSIFDLLDKLNIDYGGRYTHNIHCFFHDEANPSMRIYGDSNTVYCWVCMRSADVIAIVQDYNDLTFRQAINWIKNNFDVQSSKVDRIGKMLALKNDHQDLTEVELKVADNFVKFYFSYDEISEMVWDRIHYCWERFELLQFESYDSIMDWLQMSKQLVKRAFDFQYSINSYKKVSS